MRKRRALLLLLLLPLGCRTSMNACKDASPGAEAGPPGPAADGPVSMDGPRPDSTSSESSPPMLVPRAFRVENHTDEPIYLKTDLPVQCQVAETSGWQRCAFYSTCSVLCPEVKAQQTCCLSCEQRLELYAIPPGQSRSIPWGGTLYRKENGACSECQCDQPTQATGADYQAEVWVYTAYQCAPTGCQFSADGSIIRMASATGAYQSFKAAFSLPFFAAEEVVIKVDQPPRQDAAVPDAPTVTPDSKPAVDTVADAPRIDSARDLATEPIRPIQENVAGHTFQLASSNGLPDASMSGRSCSTSNPGAVYRLTFSADANTVTIVRTDGPQEPILTGTRKALERAGLTYDLTPAPAQAELHVAQNADGLVGTMIMFGSGVPIIWCIQAPLIPL